MLVLSRREEEKIVIRLGCDVVELMVLQIRGDKVRLGVTAPQHIKVNRSEIDRQIMETPKKEAS